MRNIPIDLLRTFVTIIDLQGYSRAAVKLGRSQPAISLQMKRFQELLGVDLFVQPGSLELSEQGHIVAAHARRMLALNDQLLDELAGLKGSGNVRIGLPNDYADRFLAELIGRLSRSQRGVTFDVVCALSHELLKGLETREYDIVVAQTARGGADGAFSSWAEPLVWVGRLEAIPASGPVRIVCYPEGCLYRQTMIAELAKGRGYEIVYKTPSFASLQAAVDASFGLTVLARRVVPRNLPVIERHEALPELPALEAGVYFGGRYQRQRLAGKLVRVFSQLFEDTVTV